MSNDLINTYVSEIGRRLPRKTRFDIEAEIRSVLQDMLEERSQKDNKPVNDELTLEVLKAYGDPEKIATTYLGDRYLVGPSLYPLFMLILRIVLIVTGILAAIGLGVALYQSARTPPVAIEIILKAIANFITSIVVALGNIVLIFAIIEWALSRSGKGVNLKDLSFRKEWEPRSLKKISIPNQVKMGETIFEIVGSFAAIVIFNFYPQIIGFTPSLNSIFETGNLSSVTFIPLLSEAFFYYVPYLTLVWALTIILDIILLRMGYWTIITRIFLIGLKLVSIFIASAMLAGPSIIALTLPVLTTSLGDAASAQVTLNVITAMVRIALWLTIIVGTVDIIRMIYRAVLGGR